MEPRLQRRIQRYGWDKAAACYENCWKEQIEPAQSRLLELASLKPGERVLDVACGTGLVTFRAATAVGVAGGVTGTDLSEGMLETARREARDRGLTHVLFERADAESPACRDGSYDAALCSLGLMYFPDPVAALAEMRRHLKPGGRAVAAVWGARNRCGWAGIFPVVDSRVQSEVCPMFFQLGTADNQARAFLAAGFTGVSSERIAVTLRYASEEDACEAAFAGGPVALAWSRFDERTRQAACEEYLASIASCRNGNGYHVPGEFVLTWGRNGC